MNGLNYVAFNFFFVDLQDLGDLLVADDLNVGAASAEGSGDGLDLDFPF